MFCLFSDVFFLRFVVNKFVELLDEKKLKSFENRKKIVIDFLIEKIKIYY